MMKNTRKIRRQQVREEIAEVSPWELSGSPEDICKELRDTENAYLDKYNKNDIIDSSWTWISPSYEGEDGHFGLTITRLENDREYNSRVKNLMEIKEKEKSAKEKEKKNEYEEYLRLKQKFDKQNWNPTPKADFSDF